MELDYWLEMIKEHCHEKCAIILVGTKSDLQREVSYEEALEYTTKNYISLFMETSSKTDVNVEKSFNELTVEIIKFNAALIKGNQQIENAQQKISSSKIKNKKSNCSC